MRLPEFTGERFVPGQGGAQIAYEHIHRYLFALRWSSGRRVLDVAAGTGYGAGLLSRVAEHVWAIDLDRDSLEFARANGEQARLTYVQSDATRLPFRAGSIDTVVAFEILEHVHEPERLVAEAARVLRPGGVALISTPNKAVYSDARDYVNPFHVREFYRDELLELLARYFTGVRLWSQQIRAGSLISTEGGPAETTGEVLVGGEPTGIRPATPPMYFLAECGDVGPADSPISAYVDPSDGLIEEWQSTVRALNGEIERLGRWGAELEAENRRKDELLGEILRQVGERDETIRALQAEMKSEVARRDAALVELRREFEERTRWVDSLRTDLTDRDTRLAATMEELHRVAEHLGRIRHALLYRILCRLKVLLP